jgi:Holliday junction resolvasome RuvABC endonuclease subunit
MLRMPQSASNLATLIGIDPGSSKMGICIMVVDAVTLEIISTDAFTIVGEKLMKKNSFMGYIHGERFARIDAIEERVLAILERTQPFDVASESPFFNPGRPNAFEVLVEVIYMIRKALWRYDPWLRLYRIDPPTVKKGVGAKSADGKDAVGKAVIALAPILNYIGITPLEKLDDNARDAIAVTKTRLEILRGKLCHNPRK